MSNTITTQPIYSHTDKTCNQVDSDTNSHKCLCEKTLTCNSTASRFYINCEEFFNSFYISDGVKKSSCCSFICFPAVLVHNLVLCLPCTMYNISRNKCAKNKEDKSYLC